MTNGDGKLDLAVASFNSLSVAIIVLGNGDGSFQLGPRYSIPSTPTSLAVSDLNGDGIADLITVCEALSTVSVLLGNGDGTFQPAQNYVVATGAYSAAIADLDSDGHLDLALVSFRDQGSLSIVWGKGDGTFWVAPHYLTGSSPFSGTVADFNGDGFPDLVVVNSSFSTPSTVTVLLNKGDGTFGRPQNYGVGINPWAVVAGDLNGDGIPDLVVPNSSSGTVSLLLGKGDGTFANALSYQIASVPSAVAVDDFNRDGLLARCQRAQNGGAANISWIFS